MRTDEFWRIVERAREGAANEAASVAARLHAVLGTADPAEIVSFDEIWEDTFRDLHTYALWGAAYVIGGGCDDDLFDYFKAYLISHGQLIVENAKHDPDSLAELMANGSEIEEWELLMYPAWNAYRMVTGQEIPLNQRAYIQPRGRSWQEADLPGLYPSLFALFDEPLGQRRERLLDNARVQAALQEHGDQLHIPRPIEHVALFPAMKLAERAAYVFGQEEFSTSEPFEHNGRFVLEFRREDRVDEENPHRFTKRIIRILHHYAGTYDGWECEITRDPEERAAGDL